MLGVLGVPARFSGRNTVDALSFLAMPIPATSHCSGRKQRKPRFGVHHPDSRTTYIIRRSGQSRIASPACGDRLRAIFGRITRMSHKQLLERGDRRR